MKSYHFILCVVITVIVSQSVKGQYYYNPYYNPYFNPYLYQQLMQNTEEFGKQMFQKKLEEIQRREKADPNSCRARIGQYIADKNLAEAREWCNHLKKVDKKSGCYYLGLVCELQGYIYSAKEQYSEGKDLGDKNCQDFLDRLNQEGEMTERQKKQCIYIL